MKKRNLTLSMVVCILIVTLLAPISGAAAGPIDTTKDASLTLLFHDGETAISSAAFDLYYVADVSADGEFTLAGDYAAYPVSLEDMDNVSMKALANTLVGYTLRDQLVPLDSGVTDQYGALKFPQKQERLNVGLYLVIGHNHAQGEYTYIPDPFLVCLPTLDLTLDQWFENVTANVKYIVTDGRDQDKVERKVLKIWDDNGWEIQRPQNVTVQLLRDGEVYDTVVLSEENNWRHSWERLESNHQWTVVEQEVENYTVLVSQEGVTYTVTNTRPGTPPPPTTTPDGPPEIPNTGQLWWPVPVLLALGLLMILLGTIRRRGAVDEE